MKKRFKNEQQLAQAEHKTYSINMNDNQPLDPIIWPSPFLRPGSFARRRGPFAPSMPVEWVNRTNDGLTALAARYVPSSSRSSIERPQGMGKRIYWIHFCLAIEPVRWPIIVILLGGVISLAVFTLLSTGYTGHLVPRVWAISVKLFCTIWVCLFLLTAVYLACWLIRQELLYRGLISHS